MADALDSHSIARRSFGVVRRGYEQQEVRAFLHEVSSLLDRLHRESSELRERAERAETRLGQTDDPDDTMLLEILGEETTRVLTSARDAAAEIRDKAEKAAERIVAEATTEAADTRAGAVREADRRLADATNDSESLLAVAREELEQRKVEAGEAARRIREEASAEAQALREEGERDLDRARGEAEAERDAARAQGREMVTEAQTVRERVLRDLAVRRKKARQQVEKLNAGRERLLQAYDVVRRTIDEATDELSSSLTDARIAADAAARRIETEPEPTLEQLDDEVTTALLADGPIADTDEHDDDSPGPFSGEVPVVDESERAPAQGTDVAEVAAAPPPANPRGRRTRKGRRRKDDFAGLAGELTRLEPAAEGESVRVLTDLDTEPAPDDVSPTDEVDGAAGDEEAGASPSVDDLFDRLRAEQESAHEDVASSEAPAPANGADPAEAKVDEPTEADPEDDDGDEATEDPTDGAGVPFAERDVALAPIDKDLARRLKRAMADEQNEVLDLLRRAKPTGVDDLLPDAEGHASRWAEVAAAPLADAAAAGATWAGSTVGPVSDLVDDLARSLTVPLRERIDRGFVASDGNLEDVADRVRALYREWKGKRLADASRHYTAAAYARGVYDSQEAKSEVHWVVDPKGGPCPDCDDNVLAGTLSKGEEFPTGHQCAPAHPGCRCLVLSASA